MLKSPAVSRIIDQKKKKDVIWKGGEAVYSKTSVNLMNL